jgi:hypothetical protein
MLKSRMLGNPLVRFPEGRGWQPHAGVPRLLDQGVSPGKNNKVISPVGAAQKNLLP